MPGIEFFQTVMGKRFYESTMPSLVRQLEHLNNNLERLIKQRERCDIHGEEKLCPECLGLKKLREQGEIP